MTFKLINRHDAADITVLVVKDTLTNAVWTIVSHADGSDLIVDPTGALHDGTMPEHATPAAVWAVVTFLGEVEW